MVNHRYIIAGIMNRYLIVTGSFLGLLLSGKIYVDNFSSHLEVRYYFRNKKDENDLTYRRSTSLNINLNPFTTEEESLETMEKDIVKFDEQLSIPDGYFLDTKIITFYNKFKNLNSSSKATYLTVEKFENLQ